MVARESNVDAVILRIGYADRMDYKVSQYVNTLNKLGIPYGFYHYNTATTVAEAQYQASCAVNFIQSIDGQPSLPVYADIEEGGNDRDQVAIARTYCQIFEQNEYKAGVYANLNYWTHYLKNDTSLNSYEKWIANYGLNDGLPRSDWRPADSFNIW
ncbi:MAG: GH25 family lysozyme [Beduini sp.]|uniref:GH25 family lysozyme n=1 Tax=Beduini sp. TaxID=1922300 RepID=UPI00399FF205